MAIVAVGESHLVDENGVMAMCKIDTLNFTIPMPTPFIGGSDDVFYHAMDLVRSNIGDVWSPIFASRSWEIQHGRGVYQFSRMDTEHEVIVSIGDVNSDVYVECRGVACDKIRSAGFFYEIFEKEEIRFSRIDLAADFETDLSVDDIIVKGYGKAFKNARHERTVQGDTTYIGSRKSERMLRIYRYHSPHPRANLLRLEVELKGDTAKLIAPRITANSIAELTLSAQSCFRLQHELVSTAKGIVSPMPSRPYDKAGKGRMRWLETQVIPALVKAHKEGDIQLREWFETRVLPHVE